MRMNEFEIADGVIAVELKRWFLRICQNCPYYAGLANDKVCNHSTPCLTNGAFDKIRRKMEVRV